MRLWFHCLLLRQERKNLLVSQRKKMVKMSFQPVIYNLDPTDLTERMVVCEICGKLISTSWIRIHFANHQVSFSLSNFDYVYNLHPFHCCLYILYFALGGEELLVRTLRAFVC